MCYFHLLDKQLPGSRKGAQMCFNQYMEAFSESCQYTEAFSKSCHSTEAKME